MRAALAKREGAGFDAVAIVFMHAYRYPEHERQVAAIAREIGFAQVSGSHECSALIKLVGRGDTTVVDAYLSPILARYVGAVSRELDVERTGARLMFMMSSGGLTAADLFAGKDAILSGPAGGVVAMAQTRARAPASSASSASTWAARRPTSRISTANTSAPSRRRSRACACARR